MLQTTKRVVNISDERRVGPLFFFPIAASLLAPAGRAISDLHNINSGHRKKGGEKEGEKKQNTFCQIDVDHLSYLSAMAAAAEAGRGGGGPGEGGRRPGGDGETSPKGFLSLLEYLIQSLEILCQVWSFLIFRRNE